MPDTGSALRLKQTREVFGYLPAFKVIPIRGEPFFICGKCFAKKGDGPFTSKDEMWIGAAQGSGTVPEDALCESCGKRAWASD